MSFFILVSYRVQRQLSYGISVFDLWPNNWMRFLEVNACEHFSMLDIMLSMIRDVFFTSYHFGQWVVLKNLMVMICSSDLKSIVFCTVTINFYKLIFNKILMFDVHILYWTSLTDINYNRLSKQIFIEIIAFDGHILHSFAIQIHKTARLLVN